MPRPLIVSLAISLSLLGLTAPASGTTRVAADPCGDGDLGTTPAPAWDLAGLDVDGVYVDLDDGGSVLDAVDVTFTVCGDVDDRPGPTAYLLNWDAGGGECRHRLHVSDATSAGLTAYLQQICPASGAAGLMLGHLVLSDRLPDDFVSVDGPTVTVRLPVDGTLDRFDPAHGEGTQMTDVRVTAGTGIVEQDDDRLEDGTFGSYPYTAWDHAEGRDLTLGEDRV